MGSLLMTQGLLIVRVNDGNVAGTGVLDDKIAFQFEEIIERLFGYTRLEGRNHTVNRVPDDNYRSGGRVYDDTVQYDRFPGSWCNRSRPTAVVMYPTGLITGKDTQVSVVSFDSSHDSSFLRCGGR